MSCMQGRPLRKLDSYPYAVVASSSCASADKPSVVSEYRFSCWSITQRRVPVPVVRLDITHHSPFMEGRPFGDVGPYQLLEGLVHFAIDPLHPCNAAITDIELAPRDATGKVSFS